MKEDKRSLVYDVINERPLMSITSGCSSVVDNDGDDFGVVYGLDDVGRHLPAQQLPVSAGEVDENRRFVRQIRPKNVELLTFRFSVGHGESRRDRA